MWWGDATMPTITTRIVSLSISNPPSLTLDDVIRGTVGPIVVTGGTISVTIPSTTQVGDLLLGVVLTSEYYTTITPDTGWDYYFDAGALQSYTSPGLRPDGINDEYDGVVLYPMYKVADSGDPGSTLTTIVEYNTPTDTFDDNSIFVLYVLKNEYITGSYAYSSSKVDVNVYDVDGGAGATTPSIDTTTPHEIVFFMSGAWGTINVTPYVSVTEICDFQASGISLYIGCRIYDTAQATGAHTIAQSTDAYNVSCVLAIPSA